MDEKELDRLSKLSEKRYFIDMLFGYLSRVLDREDIKIGESRYKEEWDELRNTRGGRGLRNYEQVKQEFDLAAKGDLFMRGYDRSVRGKKYPAPGKLAEMLVPLIEAENAEILDFACGTGLSGVPFIELDKEYVLDGIDLSAGMLADVKGKGYRKLWEKDLFKDDLSDIGKYDVAISVSFLGYYITPCTVLPKMVGVLKDESAIGFTSEAVRTKNLRSIVRYLEKEGFEVEVKHDIAIKHWFSKANDFYVVGKR